MAEMNNPKEVGSLYTAAHRDESLDIGALISQKPVEEPVAAKEEAAPQNLSPLAALKAKQEVEGKGIKVSNEALKEGLDNGPQKNVIYNDRRMAGIQERIDEADASLKKRAAIVVIKQPKGPQEYTEMMIEIDSVEFDADGKAYSDYKDDYGTPTAWKYIRLRTEEDGAFSTKNDKEILFGKTGEETDTPEAGESAPTEPTAKDKIVKLIIDKTGFGANIDFTQEEREKLYEAHEIQLTDVEVLDLATVTGPRSVVSFQDFVAEHTMANSSTTVCFPASGYTADMKALTYGEMSDIALSMDTIDFDKYYKRLSIIYNKMSNPSCGKFKDFEDFLRKTSYTDISLALYGMYVSTQPEIQSLELSCGNDKCNQSFEWKFSTRSVLHLENCAETFLEKMSTLANAAPEDYDEIALSAAVNNSRFVKLPISGLVAEIGVASCYEFLYNFIPVLNEQTFKETFGREPNAADGDNILLLTAIRSIRRQTADGWVVAEGYQDILTAIGMIKPEEIRILSSLSNKVVEAYVSEFSLGKTVCPNCGAVTENLAISMDDLVFRTYQRLMSTEIDASRIQGF